MSRLDDQFDEETYVQIKRVAESGIVDDSDWIVLQKLLRCRLDNIIDTYQAREETKENQDHEPNVEKFDLKSLREDIIQMMDSFYEPPFTIQRICELLYSPFGYYDRVSTFLRALEKNLRVISPNDWPKSPLREPECSVSGPECPAAVPKLTPSELKRLADDPKWANERFPYLAAGLGHGTSLASESSEPDPEPLVEPLSEPATGSKTDLTVDPATEQIPEPVLDPPADITHLDTQKQSLPEQEKEMEKEENKTVETGVTQGLRILPGT